MYKTQEGGLLPSDEKMRQGNPSPVETPDNALILALQADQNVVPGASTSTRGGIFQDGKVSGYPGLRDR